MSKVSTNILLRKSWASQERKVFNALQSLPMTRLQVSSLTGVPIQNITRYIASFRKAGTVYVIGVDRCPISGMKAEFLSTDEKYRPKAQLSMFQWWESYLNQFNDLPGITDGLFSSVGLSLPETLKRIKPKWKPFLIASWIHILIHRANSSLNRLPGSWIPFDHTFGKEVLQNLFSPLDFTDSQ